MLRTTFLTTTGLALAIALMAPLSITAFAQNKENQDKAPAKGQQANTDAQQEQSNKRSENPTSDSQQSQNDTRNNSDQNPPRQDNNAGNAKQSKDARNNQPPNDTNTRQPNSRNNDQPQRQDRDGQTEQLGNNRNPANRNANNINRDSSRQQANRDFRRDFKFGAPVTRGLTISTIARDSIFYRSGLRDRDIIVSYGGRPIRSQDDFVRFVVYQPGQRIPVVFLRDGREETIYVVYEQDNIAQSPANARAYFGAEFDPQSTNGAVVTRVQPGSPAHKAGLMPNDLVVALNGDQVSSGRDAIQIVSSLAAGERLEIEYTRHVRTDAVLAANNRDTSVDAATYQSTDRRTRVGIGVGTDDTRRNEAELNRDNSNSEDPNQRDNRGERRGILPRLRN